MVDKLSFVKSPRSLRCSFKIFPMLCPILIGPLFHQGFHTNVRLDFLSAHGHGTVRPVRPRLLFLFPSEIILIRISITFNLRNFTSHQLFFFFFLQRLELWQVIALVHVVLQTIFLPSSQCARPNNNDNLIDQTCKQTLNYNLCLTISVVLYSLGVCICGT